MDRPFNSITAASTALKDKDISPVELVGKCLDRAEFVQGEINPFVIILHDQALTAARKAEAEIAKGNY